MSNDHSTPLAGERQANFRCPVCRARQQLARECRRCKADLTLVYQARTRLAYLQELPATATIRAEIQALSPEDDQ